MKIITEIEPQKNGKRVNIYLDGKFGFGIDLTNLVLLDLKVNQELSEEKVAEIIKKAEFQKTYDYLLKFATLRPRSEAEVKNWLSRKKVHSSLYLKLLKKLINLNLLDDEKFAEWWVGQRLQFRSKSKRELEQELRIKGITKEIIEKVLQESEVDENKAARAQLAKNLYRFEKYDKKIRNLKTAQFLARKGFGWEVIQKILKVDQDN